MLDFQQQTVLQDAMAGKSLCITGPAGSGKTYVLRKIINSLTVKHGKHSRGLNPVAVTASTGIAALNIEGITLHRFAGISGPDAVSLTTKELAQKVRENARARRRWQSCKVLIIDEISQVSASLFEKLDFIASKIVPADISRGRSFGGLQVIVCGDFCQLPPVIKSKKGEVKYIFETQAWKKLFGEGASKQIYYLRNNYRQQSKESVQSHFIELLKHVRIGKVDNSDVQFIKTLSETDITDLNAIHLVSTLKQAEAINRKGYENLVYLDSQVERYSFKAIDFGPSPIRQYFVKEIEKKVPQNLDLCVGLQIILNVNLNPDEGLVNGRRGVISSFVYDEDDENFYPVVKFNESPGMYTIKPFEFELALGSDVLCSRTQLPIQICYALTIHRAQGLEFESVCVDLKGCFSTGQAYVALSRAKDPTKLKILNFDISCLKCCLGALEFYEPFAEKQCEKTIIEASNSFCSPIKPPKRKLLIIPETPEIIKKRIRFQLNSNTCV